MADGEGISGGDIAGVAAGSASLIPALFGRGQNKRIAPGFVGQAGYDPNASQYGGSPGGLHQYLGGLSQATQATDNRGANLADYSQANTWQNASAQARQGQLQLAQAQQARALGQVPSIAQMQGDRAMQQAQAAQGAQQASARGAAGLALAGQAAAGNTANAQSAIAGQTQVNAANERMQAEQAAQQAYGNIRGGDQASQGQGAQQAQFQAGMQQTSRDANDQRAMGYETLGANARAQQLSAGVQNQGTLAGSYNAANVANQTTGNQNAGSKGIISTVKDFFSDERAKIPLLSLGGGGVGPAGASGAAPTSFEVLGAGGAEDVAASGKRMSDYATRFQRDPTATNDGPGALTNPGSMMSDRRTKTPILSLGGRHGPRGKSAKAPVVESGFNPDAPRGAAEPADSTEPAPQLSRFDTVNGWTQPGSPQPPDLDGAIARQAQQDREDSNIARQVSERQAIDARDARDPAVGLDRIARDRGSIRGPGPMDDNAQTDADKGLAPGTTDFASTEPKVEAAAGGKPWWTAIGSAAKSLNDAQFGSGRPMLSDERAKRAAYIQGRADGSQSSRSGEPVPYAVGAPLGEDEELVQPKDGASEIRSKRPALPRMEKPATAGMFDRDTSNFAKPKPAPAAAGPSWAGSMFDRDAESPAVSPVDRRAAMKQTAPNLDGFKNDDTAIEAARHAAIHGAGTADPVANANRAMVGSAYAYKPGLTPPDQKPGEPNFGPMAQNMEKNPITATAVKTDPATGLKVIDKDKALKVTMAGLADLQEQNDNIRAMLAMGGRKRQ